MASLEPQSLLNSRRAHTRPHYASRSLSQLPRFNECQKQIPSQDTAREEMLALLRSGSQRSTSSAKSTTSSNQSAIGPAVLPVSTPPARPERSPSRVRSPEYTNAATIDASFAPTSSLSPRARRQLLRSARKVGYILGETPVLCTNGDASDARNSGAEPSELGILPSFSSLSVSNAKVKGSDSLDAQKRSRPKANTGCGVYDGLANAFATPHQYTSLTADGAPSPSAPALSRVPPVLKVDCAVVAGSNKRSKLGASDEAICDADAQSFVSTTTTTTITSDLFSPSTSRRSPITPIEGRFAMNESGKELAREARRSKVAKLSRHLGESVPAELVFPLEAIIDPEDSEPYVLISYDDSSPISPLANKSTNSSSTPESKVIQPPTRSASLRRRKRKSLDPDPDGSPSSFTSTPSSPSGEIGSAPSKYKPARVLSRSQSVRSRLRKNANASPSSRQFSDGRSSENTLIHPASAPPAPTVHISGDHENASRDPDLEEGRKERESEVRTPLGDAQRALNVRRAQKMLSVFGEAPPNTMLPVKSKCDSPSAIGRSVMGGTRFKRHSICSILTSASSFMDAQPATFDSPVSPITPRPRILEEVTSTPTRTSTSRDSLKLQTNVSPRRRASLSALPGTPPPFSQYFGPPSPLATQQDAQNESPEQSTTTPKATRSHSDTIKHSPHSSSGSSASPPTPGSSPPGGQVQLAQEQDPGAVFRERRLRAAKLARFFGVGYGDLYPVLIGDEDVNVRLSKSSFDSIRSARMESFEKEKERVEEREKKLAAKRKAAGTRVSVTVQREVDDPRSGRMVFSPSMSESSSDLSLSETEENTTAESAEAGAKKPADATAIPLARSVPESASVLKTTSKRKDIDGTAVGCYGGLSFSSGLAPSRSSSTRRRAGQGTDAAATAAPPTNNTNRNSKNVGPGLSFGLGTGMFSLGRQSRRTTDTNDANLGSSFNAATLGSGSATLGRKGSTPTRRAGGRALTFGERRSILSRASCGEFGLSSRTSNTGTGGARTSFLHSKKPSLASTDESAEGVGIAITTTEAQERERERMAPRVRVGEKIADVSEVMAKLRELR